MSFYSFEDIFNAFKKVFDENLELARIGDNTRSYKINFDDSYDLCAIQFLSKKVQLKWSRRIFHKYPKSLEFYNYLIKEFPEKAKPQEDAKIHFNLTLDDKKIVSELLIKIEKAIKRPLHPN